MTPDSEYLRQLLREARGFITDLQNEYGGKIRDRIDAALDGKAYDPRLTVREACRRRMFLDGADAQALEHALTITERERDEAVRTLEGIRKLYSPEAAAALRAENGTLRARVAGLEWDRETACENTPTKDCECPGCCTARERAEKGQA